MILLMGDAIITVFSLMVSLYFWAQKDWLEFSFQFLRERPPFWFYLLPVIWILLMVELYDVRRASRRSETAKGVGIAALVSLGLYLLVFFISEPNSLPRRGVAVFIVAASLLTLLWRFIYIRIFTAPVFLRRVLIIGAGRAGTTLAEVIHEIKPSPFHLVGFIDDDPTKVGTLVSGFPVLAGSGEMLDIIRDENISDLIFAISGSMKPEMLQTMLKAEEQGVEVTTMPIVYEELRNRVPILLLQSDWIVRSFVDEAHAGGFYEMAKRLMDIFGGLVGCVFLVLLFPLVAITILIDSGAPVFYSQERLGRNGRPYRVYKFRTMRRDAESDGEVRVTVKNDERITRIGRVLRRSHLDEFPQFINILRGDMSLVGPRAERTELVDALQKHVPFYRARLLVKPGLTGWAQINYGYAATVEDTAIKLEYDLYYIKHRSLLMDIIILLRTVGQVVGLRGQ